MSTIGLRGESATKAMPLAALVSALIVASLVVNVLTILADGTVRHRTSSVDGCSNSNEIGRPGCYDKLGQQPLPHPFKGANAPAVFSSR
jgi:hypothetical protein